MPPVFTSPEEPHGPPRLISPERFRRLTRQALGPPLLLLALFGVLIVAQVAHLVTAARWEDHSDKVIAQANRTLKLAVDAETGQRGYLVGGRSLFLQPYRETAVAIGPAFDRLASLVTDSPLQSARVRAARAGYGQWLAEAQAEIALRDHGGDYRPYFNQARGKALMDALRGDFAGVIDAEDAVRERRERAVRQATRVTLVVTLASALLLGLLLAALSRRQMQSLASQYDGALASEIASRELLSATLMGIGDAVLVTDAHGRVTLLNPVAERLTGWRSAEAVGQDSRRVFPIINADSRAEVASPIERVIREGVVVGLANHTLLVRRDGTEVPIDDSGAPIRDADGRLTGVVLVFRDVSERYAAEREAQALLRREQAIAEQLQAALQPVIPEEVPGLRLADYYRPALAEAGVGGDFSDIFAADKGVTFLAVGDLSGKGLAAASQVATVRNMLRFALYNGRTVAGPINSLNATLADNNLITGFATLFVGRYDAEARELTYVNCGQEAGLILRAATGEVETLPPTGPVLGAISGATYAEKTVTLGIGDTLALYTDGLTEAGPTRATLLGGDGVAGLLRQQAGQADPYIIVERLMAGVDAHTGVGMRDDQCMLIGLATETEAS